MTDGTIAAACAASLFVIALGMGLAGADKPPPVSFLLFAGVVGVLCAVAFARTKTHLAARSAGRPGVWLRVGLEGMTQGSRLPPDSRFSVGANRASSCRFPVD